MTREKQSVASLTVQLQPKGGRVLVVFEVKIFCLHAVN